MLCREFSEVRGTETWARDAVQFYRGARVARAALVDGDVGVVVAPQGRLFRVLKIHFAREDCGSCRFCLRTSACKDVATWQSLHGEESSVIHTRSCQYRISLALVFRLLWLNRSREREHRTSRGNHDGICSLSASTGRMRAEHQEVCVNSFCLT